MNFTKPNMSKAYKENLTTINKTCRLYSIKFKIDYEDLLSESNEIFINSHKKYFFSQMTFKQYFYMQLNNYLKMYCKKEILRREHNKIIEFSLPAIYEEIKKEQQRLSDLSEAILNYCLDQNTESEMVYQKIKYKNKVYNYTLNLEKITQKNIKEYFKNLGYSLKDILGAITEIKYLLKKELI